MHDDITVEAEYKQGMPMSNTHVNKNFQINIFHKIEQVNSSILSLCLYKMLSEVCISNF